MAIPYATVAELSLVRSSLLHPAKPQLLYFRGSGGFGVLRRNLTALSRFERVHISLGEDYCPRCSASEVSYAEAMQSSTFCLAPSGHTCTTRRFFDAIAAGCVPVVIDCEQQALPFESQLDYGRFMLFYPFARMMSDLEAFVGCLRKLEANPTRMRELRAALQRAREALVYSWLPRSYNASADVLHSGWDRTEPSALTGYLLREAINTTSGAAPKRPRHVRERDAGYLPRLGTVNRTDFCSLKM